jgi:hypothetical protein
VRARARSTTCGNRPWASTASSGASSWSRRVSDISGSSTGWSAAARAVKGKVAWAGRIGTTTQSWRWRSRGTTPANTSEDLPLPDGPATATSG